VEAGQKGIVVNEETIDEVIEALQRARDQLRTGQA
jgi:hypothetical protein